MKKLFTVFLFLVLLVGPGIAAVGTWNGVAFTSLNGVALTSWNGTGISCASSSYDPTTYGTCVERLYAPTIAQSDDTAITTWTAVVGQNATQATSGNRPHYRTAVLNGRDVVQFDRGSAQYMTTAGFVTAAQPCVAVVVFKYTGEAFHTASIFCDTAKRVNARHFATGDIFAAYAEDGVAEQLIGAGNANWHIALIEYNGASSKFVYDGGAVTTFTVSPGSFGIGGLVLANDETLGTSTMTGYIAEILVFSGTITDGNKTALVAYMNAHWAAF